MTLEALVVVLFLLVISPALATRFPIVDTFELKSGCSSFAAFTPSTSPTLLY
jgi:hypothetical protein